METIRQLLSRIRWDDEFGRGVFEVGIYDRLTDQVDFHPLESLHMNPGNHATFKMLIDDHTIKVPYHRIREVRKNGKTIWKR